MKISVLVIAHNEDQHIHKCLSSLLGQSQKPDEIIVVVHNSDDDTELIAKKFPVTVVPYRGPVGSIYSRIESLKHATGDIILCTDGDSIAAKNWVEEMVKTLKRNNLLVGSWVRMRGTFYNFLSNIYNKYYCVRQKDAVERWIWGASFAFWGRDKEFVSETLQKTEKLSEQLNLTRNPDDCWLAMFMKRRGSLEVTNKTYVSPYAKEDSSHSAITRNLENIKNGDRIEKYFKESI